eukprot:COSAG05_NODE_537_length_8855_cov_23.915829_2_plen_277_part_00
MVFGRGVETGASTSAGVAEGGQAAERYVWEAVTGNWAAESIVTQRECDVMGRSAKSPQRRATAQCSSREGKFQFWKKAMYVAAINRTFLIHGNVMDGVPGRPHRCDTAPGSNTALMLEAAELMFYMFGGVVAGSNGTLEAGCVGNRGLWPFQVRQTRIAQAVHTVYGAPDDSHMPLPGHDWPVELIIHELPFPHSEHFLPVSFALTEAPGGGANERRFSSVTGLYTDWNSSSVPIPAQEWDIPGVCFTDSGLQKKKNKTWRERTPESLSSRIWPLS